MKEKEEMKNNLVGALVGLLMEDDPSLSMEEALGIVFNSETYQKIQDERTNLYVQSPGYVYSFLEHELRTGKMG